MGFIERQMAAFVLLILASQVAGQDAPPVELPRNQHGAAESDPVDTTSLPVKKREPGGESGLGGFGMGGGRGGPGYGVTWYPTSPVSGSNHDLGLVRQQISGGIPVWREGGDAVILTASVRSALFFTEAVLPESGRPFPETLWNVSLGLNYVHKFDNGWSGGLGASVGSASDRPFHGIEEMYFNFLGFVRIPARNDRDAWIFSLMYSPVGNVNFPIPGIAYAWNPNDELQVNIGIPFSILWKPTEDWTFNVSYFPVTNVNARVTYRVFDPVFVFAGFEWLYEAYFLADRENQRDRFLAFEKRLISGVRWDFGPKASFDVNAGYAFDRYYGEGQNTFRNMHDRIDIAPGAFFGANLRMRY